jgi:hypothetical protein
VVDLLTVHECVAEHLSTTYNCFFFVLFPLVLCLPALFSCNYLIPGFWKALRTLHG